MTLIETLLCVAILSIMSGMVTLTLGQSLAKQELESASRQLAADIRWMQQLSINSGIDIVAYALLFNHKTPYGYCITANTKVIKNISFPASISLSGAQSYIYFSVNGTPVVGAQSISLYSSRLKAWNYVIVAPVTGRVRISDKKSTQIGE